MSKGTKREFKQFTINNVEDACYVLGILISGVIVHLEKYKEYVVEAKTLLDCTEEKLVSAKKYDDIKDKILLRQHELLKHIADRQKSSFSYVDFRDLLLKKKYLSKPLTEELRQVLNELLDVRNWSFHNVQSLIVAGKESAEKRIPAELKGLVKVGPQLNPVITKRITAYDIETLVSLVWHTHKRIDQFEKVLDSMKTDYQELYDSIDPKPMIWTADGLSSEIQYVVQDAISRINDYDSDIAQISMAIQKSKYDGSDKVFNEWGLGKKDQDEFSLS